MKQRRYTLPLAALMAAVVFMSAGCVKSGGGRTLHVYCYDSFASEWGPGPALAEGFEKETGIKIQWHAPGDAGTVLAQLIAEKEHPTADVVIGLDSAQAQTAFWENLLVPCSPENLKGVPEDLRFDPDNRLIPFDYGHFAVIYDTESAVPPPASLEELTRPEYKDALILMDPRTSSPGLGFLMWTVAVYGAEAPAYWQRLKPSVLTVTDGWSQGYGLMLAGEAPLVISYGTSPVYHKQYEDTTRYRALEFTDDGHMMQIEGMGLVRGSKNKKEGELFLNWLLGTEAQGIIALGNIMLPARPDAPLPPSFSEAMKPAKTYLPEPLTAGRSAEEWTDLWVETLTGR